MALDGAKPNLRSSGAEGFHCQLGGANLAMRCGGIDRDDAHEREAVKDVVDQLLVVMACLLKAPSKEGGMRARRTGSPKHLLNMKRS